MSKRAGKKLEGRRALVTAGGQGIGLAIARELLEAGCAVGVHYFSSREGAEKLRGDYGEKVKGVQADLGDRAAAAEMVEAVAAELGGLEILVNNAGSLVERRWLEGLDREFYDKVFDVNLASMMWVTQAARPHLQAAGAASVVNLSSLAGRKGGHAGSLLYSTAKGAVLTWTRALAAELGPEGIRVNAVAPGLILGTRFHATHTTEASARKTIEGIPLERAGSPEDVARAVAFLASEYDGFISGATLDINGGVYCA